MTTPAVDTRPMDSTDQGGVSPAGAVDTSLQSVGPRVRESTATEVDSGELAPEQPRELTTWEAGSLPRSRDDRELAACGVDTPTSWQDRAS